jgi:hypothetical protein
MVRVDHVIADLVDQLLGLARNDDDLVVELVFGVGVRSGRQGALLVRAGDCVPAGDTKLR